ncbi:DUF4365 domain-containing protein [Pectobacterium brasiliense]|uniref:DUF4365 domain-containing protein n=1 Tax=Pectobacterium brasiliense TaxID=180957 RepID=UPI00069B9FFF|nr:DUF4365 domain-containing protein [Pectobacterium brasiliense]MCG5050385.1 DUF4365 domain-containing protein [Pectobacterium brasiliense]MCL6379150.1 DUF4365 domain-containing protein [Pectobacterium brasiliense]
MKAPKSELISRAGVHYAGYIFSLEGLIFRETGSTDVGIDGQLELVTSEDVATGLLVGIQIKSGDSFVNKETRVFSFKANKEHFLYWKNLCIPAIGIVYSPALRTASWFDLAEQTEKILNGESPPVIRQVLDKSNIIDIGIGLNTLISRIHSYYKIPVEKSSINKLRIVQEQSNSETATTKEASWKRLIFIFFSPYSDAETIGEVGYVLSWYFPIVSDEQKVQFKNRLQRISLSELNRVVGAISLAMSRDRDDVMSLILDLLSYHSGIISLLKKLEAEGEILPKDKWLIEQMIEYISD